MEDARHVFDTLPHRDVASWNAMISGYVDQEEIEEAFKLYEQMQEHSLSANSTTFASILKVCAATGALETEMELHAEICRVGLETTEVVASTLIDMYAKCGSMLDAQKLFIALARRDAVIWNALIAGYARQAEAVLIFHLFERMRQEGVQPNAVTFLLVLILCSHTGLVDEGQNYFQTMSKQYDVSPTIEHHNCMVDLLGRAGQVHEALAIVEKTPIQPDLRVWLTLLGACQKWNNVEVGRCAFECAANLDEKHAAAYVLMSNIYANTKMWEEHDRIQVLRRNALSMEETGGLTLAERCMLLFGFSRGILGSILGEELKDHCLHWAKKYVPEGRLCVKGMCDVGIV